MKKRLIAFITALAILQINWTALATEQTYDVDLSLWYTEDTLETPAEGASGITENDDGSIDLSAGTAIYTEETKTINADSDVLYYSFDFSAGATGFSGIMLNNYKFGVYADGETVKAYMNLGSGDVLGTSDITTQTTGYSAVVKIGKDASDIPTAYLMVYDMDTDMPQGWTLEAQMPITSNTDTTDMLDGFDNNGELGFDETYFVSSQKMKLANAPSNLTFNDNFRAYKDNGVNQNQTAYLIYGMDYVKSAAVTAYVQLSLTNSPGNNNSVGYPGDTAMAIDSTYIPKIYGSSDNSTWVEYQTTHQFIESGRDNWMDSYKISTSGNFASGTKFVKVELNKTGSASGQARYIILGSVELHAENTTVLPINTTYMSIASDSGMTLYSISKGSVAKTTAEAIDTAFTGAINTEDYANIVAVETLINALSAGTAKNIYTLQLKDTVNTFKTNVFSKISDAELSKDENDYLAAKVIIDTVEDADLLDELTGEYDASVYSTADTMLSNVEGTEITTVNYLAVSAAVVDIENFTDALYDENDSVMISIQERLDAIETRLADVRIRAERVTDGFAGNQGETLSALGYKANSDLSTELSSSLVVDADEAFTNTGAVEFYKAIGSVATVENKDIYLKFDIKADNLDGFAGAVFGNSKIGLTGNGTETRVYAKIAGSVNAEKTSEVLEDADVYTVIVKLSRKASKNVTNAKVMAYPKDAVIKDSWDLDYDEDWSYTTSEGTPFTDDLENLTKMYSSSNNFTINTSNTNIIAQWSDDDALRLNYSTGTGYITYHKENVKKVELNVYIAEEITDQHGDATVTYSVSPDGNLWTDIPATKTGIGENYYKGYKLTADNIPSGNNYVKLTLTAPNGYENCMYLGDIKITPTEYTYMPPSSQSIGMANEGTGEASFVNFALERTPQGIFDEIDALTKIVQESPLRDNILAFQTVAEALPESIQKDISTEMAQKYLDENDTRTPQIDYITINGTAKVGQTLSAEAVINDLYGNKGNVVYSWSTGSNTNTAVMNSAGNVTVSATVYNIADVKGETKTKTITVSGDGSGGGGDGVVSRPSPSGTSANPSTSNVPPAPSQKPNTGSFSDTANHWADKEINQLKALGIVEGDNGKYYPDDSITRAEFATLIVRAIGLNTDATLSFKDVNADDWYNNIVSAIVSAGIMNGADDGFYPNKNISREEIAKTIVSAYEYASGKVLSEIGAISYMDSNYISDWAKIYIDKCTSSGLMNGMDDANFAPKSDATRAQAAVLIVRLLEMLK